ncbi:hypothetical protein C0J52_22296 [Blattella germanica]|nr:hypothetical protein C0J52_22296 [Blattella germanica]
MNDGRLNPQMLFCTGKAWFHLSGFGDSAVFKWHQRVSQGRDSLEDDQRMGRPPTVRTESKIEEVAMVVHANRSQSVDDISSSRGEPWNVPKNSDR